MAFCTGGFDPHADVVGTGAGTKTVFGAGATSVLPQAAAGPLPTESASSD